MKNISYGACRLSMLTWNITFIKNDGLKSTVQMAGYHGSMFFALVAGRTSGLKDNV